MPRSRKPTVPVWAWIVGGVAVVGLLVAGAVAVELTRTSRDSRDSVLAKLKKGLVFEEVGRDSDDVYGAMVELVKIERAGHGNRVTLARCKDRAEAEFVAKQYTAETHVWGWYAVVG